MHRVRSQGTEGRDPLAWRRVDAVDAHAQRHRHRGGSQREEHPVQVLLNGVGINFQNYLLVNTNVGGPFRIHKG
eukprot:795791-Pleurochrysis_carterae.AAC.3